VDKEKRMNEALAMCDQFYEAFQRTVTLAGRISDELDEITQKMDCLSDIYERVTNRWEAEDEKEEDTK
jgi:hypothetical protein